MQLRTMQASCLAGLEIVTLGGILFWKKEINPLGSLIQA